jgi:hypothetical protein
MTTNLSGPLVVEGAVTAGGTVGTGAITSSGLVTAANISTAGTIGAASVTVSSTLTIGTNVWAYGTGAPPATLGTWRAGDIIWNKAPTAAGTIGWSCITGGTAGGTWKAFGTLAA